MDDTGDDNNAALAVIWDDEEPIHMKLPITEFQRKFGWSVETFRTPHRMLERVLAMSKVELGRSILILDIMMPIADDDEVFTPEATHNGLLTGLKVGEELFKAGKLADCRALFFYSVLSFADLVTKVEAFVRKVSERYPDLVVEFVHKTEITFGELPAYIQSRLNVQTGPVQ